MYSCSKSSAQVRWTGQDVSQTLIPHELPATLLDQPFHLSSQRLLVKSQEYVDPPLARPTGILKAYLEPETWDVKE